MKFSLRSALLKPRFGKDRSAVPLTRAGADHVWERSRPVTPCGCQEAKTVPSRERGASVPRSNMFLNCFDFDDELDATVGEQNGRGVRCYRLKKYVSAPPPLAL